MASKPTLWIIGAPLRDGAAFSTEARERLATADLYIGETRKVALRLLSKVEGAKEKPLYLMDESSRPEEKEWSDALKAAAKAGQTVALFSDTGMPVLFDPGKQVVETARRLGFVVRSLSAPTSWGSACALSAFDPPFLLVGFPPREDGPRAALWRQLKDSKAHCVLMERPYRFTALLGECRQVFGPKRPAFLAWELDSEEEQLLWGSVADLEAAAKRFTKTKGEFVLVISA